jgi:hypothetical protein
MMRVARLNIVVLAVVLGLITVAGCSSEESDSTSTPRTDETSPSSTNPNQTTTNPPIYFGPESPAGQESNWLETPAGHSWWPRFRLFGQRSPCSTRPGSFQTSRRWTDDAPTVLVVEDAA